MVRGVLFNWDFELDFDMVVKSVRQTLSILAWSWALFIFFLSYFGQGGGDYNHINNDMEDVPIHPAPIFSSVIVPILRIWILLLAITFGHPNPENEKKISDDAKPGSAGHHGSVQSGQFLLTNNDNYGLQISHTPYNSPSEQDEGLPRAQKLTQTRQQQQPATTGEYCAGCTSLSNPQQNQNYNARPPNAYAVPVQRQQQPQQVSFSTGHNSGMQQQPGYSYSVNYQGNPGQNPIQRDSSWGWNNWNQQSQPIQQQQQQYQWGQKIQQSQFQPQQQNFNTDPATVQHLQINDDGGYSFGYNAADSSRQEQRNMDGIVSGSYAYTDPTGQQVQVDYRASPDQGFHAYGPSIPLQNPNPIPAPQYELPVPPQDTPEVQAARAQFFEAYNQQLKFIEKAQAEAKARTNEYEAQQAEASGNEPKSDPANKNGNVVAVHSETSLKNKDSKNKVQDANTAQQINKDPFSASDFKTLPEPIAIPDSNTASPGVENEEDDELENDAVVVSRDDEPSSVPAAVNVPPQTVTAPRPSTQQQGVMQSNQNGPQAGYSFSVLVGDQTHGARGVENQQQQWPYWGNSYQYQQQPQPQPFTVGYQYQQPGVGAQLSNTVEMPAYMTPSYQLSHMVGAGVPNKPPQSMPLGYHPQQVPIVSSQTNAMNDGNMQQNTDQQSNQGNTDSNTVPTSPAYFYYVSVGGSPHYVSSSNLFNTEFPTSLKAHLAGSIPMDARHDPQVPHQNMGVVQNEVGTKSNPPVYLDVDPSKMSQSQGYNNNQNQQGQSPATIVGFIPGALVSLRNGGYISVTQNSAAVAQTGNGGTSVQIRNNNSPGQSGNTGHQFPLFIFNQK